MHPIDLPNSLAGIAPKQATPGNARTTPAPKLDRIASCRNVFDIICFSLFAVARMPGRSLFLMSIFILAGTPVAAASLDPNFFGAQVLTRTRQTVFGDLSNNLPTDEDYDAGVPSAATGSAAAGGSATASYNHATGVAELQSISDKLPVFVNDSSTPIFNSTTTSFAGIDILSITADGVGVPEKPLVPSPELTISLHLEGTYSLDTAQVAGTQNEVLLQAFLLTSGNNALPSWTASTASNCATDDDACLTGGVISEVVSTTFMLDRVGDLNFWTSAVEPSVSGRATNGASLDLTATIKIGLTNGYSFTSNSGVFLTEDPIAPVPLPAGFPLLLGAMAGMALLRRRIS